MLIKRYKERIAQYRQNRTFAVDRTMLNELNEEGGGENFVASAEESRKFWSDICSTEKEHTTQAEWLSELR